MVSATVWPANGTRSLSLLLGPWVEGTGEGIISLIAGIDGATSNGSTERPGFELPRHVPVTRFHGDYGDDVNVP